jgi:hypothetical protein
MIPVVIAMIAAFVLQSSNVFATEPSLMRIMVVPSAGQLSLVVEMSDEARRVSTQQASATVLLLEAGPIAPPVKRQILNAPSGLSLLQQVTIDEGTDANEHVLRLRVAMKRAAPSTVRTVGRRIYIDFMTADVPMPALSTAPAAAAALDGRRKASLEPQGNRPSASALAYRQTVTGAASKFEEIQPFLISATTAAQPNPAVLNAVAQAITDVQQSLHNLQASREGGPSLQLLVSATSLAAESVSAGFQGDRASKAKQSLAVFAAAKAQLQ